MSTILRANGKLLLTGEYFVLDGAAALALPTLQGQSLHIEEMKQPFLRWKSWSNKGECWFEGSFELPSFEIKQTSDASIAAILIQLFQVIEEENNFFFKTKSWFSL